MTRKLKIILLICAFAFSLDITWDYLIPIELALVGRLGTFAQNRYAFQVMSGLFYLDFTIFFTDDGERFARFLEKHKRIGMLVEGYLRFTNGLIQYAILLPCEYMLIASSEDDKNRIDDERETIIKRTAVRYKECNGYPLLIRFIYAGVIVVLPVTVLTLLLPDVAAKYVAVITKLATVIGFIFVCANCTDKRVR